jgi:crossover junction endodeoxyribonuclease RusA
MSNPLFEMLIPRRPLSHQVKNRENLQAWKDYIYGRARSEWSLGTPHANSGLQLTLVYLCGDYPADIDNIIKPIQDALIGVVYADDALICDVDSHRRLLSDPIDIMNLPPLLIAGFALGEECIYIRVCLAKNLEAYL